MNNTQKEFILSLKWQYKLIKQSNNEQLKRFFSKKIMKLNTLEFHNFINEDL